MIFKTAYNHKHNFFSPSGKRVVDEYGVFTKQLSDDPNDKKDIFGIVGQRDIYTPIQMAKPATEIGNILKRAQMGDPYAIPHQTPSFVDISGMPSSLVEAYTLIKNAKSIYKGLADSEKVKFPTFDSFLSNFEAQVTVSRETKKTDEGGDLNG